jgi:2-methylcitrate dehydratase PrpD
MSSICRQLARFALETKYQDLPAQVVQETKHLLMDSIGSGLAAVTTDPGKMAIALARMMGGPAESSIIGVGDKVSTFAASLANGQLINTIDFDTVVPGGHTPPYIIPPPLAIGEKIGASGKDLILAATIGFEIATRVARALPSGMYFDEHKQFRYAEREGYAKANFGAAAAAGILLNLNQQQMENALGTAGHLSQVNTWGRFNWAIPRNMTKYGMPGWQNTGAVSAALLAKMGFQGDISLFDDDQGFWRFTGYGSWNPEKVMEDIGKTWYFTEVRYKRYACCGSLHGILDCLYAILEKNKFEPEDVESVTAWCSPTVDAPLVANRDLNNIVDVQFSAPNVFALAINGVRTGVDWQDWETVTQLKIVELAKKVTLKGDPDFGKNPVNRVELVAKGKKYTEEKKGTSTKLSPDELVTKFKHNASRVLTLNKIDGSVKAFTKLENVANVSELMSLLTI